MGFAPTYSRATIWCITKSATATVESIGFEPRLILPRDACYHYTILSKFIRLIFYISAAEISTGGGTRTLDHPRIRRELYQLSYPSIITRHNKDRLFSRQLRTFRQKSDLVDFVGFEPTYSLRVFAACAFIFYYLFITYILYQKF